MSNEEENTKEFYNDVAKFKIIEKPKINGLSSIYNSKKKKIKPENNESELNSMFQDERCYSSDLSSNIAEEKMKRRIELETKASIANMGEIVTSTKEKPIVGTNALATCNGIIFYDRQNKKAWVGHGPASSSIATLHKMIEYLKDVAGIIEYGIIPGWDNVNRRDLKTTNLMIEYLHNNCPKQIKLMPLLNLHIKKDNGINPSYEFAFDAETGKSVTDELFYECENIELSSKII